MTSFTGNRPGPQVRVDETRQERAYRATISILCPAQDEMAMAARVDIAMMRDQASAGAQTCCDEAAATLNEIVRLASHSVYAALDTRKLLMIRLALVQMLDAARTLERVVS